MSTKWANVPKPVVVGGKTQKPSQSLLNSVLVFIRYVSTPLRNAVKTVTWLNLRLAF